MTFASKLKHWLIFILISEIIWIEKCKKCMLYKKSTKKSSLFYLNICLSVQILFYLFAFVKEVFQLNYGFHVHLINFHQCVFIIFEYNWLILFFWVDGILESWSVSFILLWSLIFEIFNISRKFDKPTWWLRKSRWKRIFELLKLSLEIFLTH